MYKKIDARGLACPLPVINTKKAVESMEESGIVEVLVDNEIAVQNLTKYATQKKLAVSSEKESEKLYKVNITVGDVVVEEKSEPVCTPDARRANNVVVISGDTMGSGDAELGKILMKAFIFALTKQEVLPETILLYNSGAYLSCEGSESLSDLKTLEAEGVEIMTCGTCLSFYGISERLAVGTVTNMYDIVEKMSSATLLIRP